MLSQSRQTRIRAHQLCDGVLFALALALVYWLREALSGVETLGLSPLEPFAGLAWLLPVALVCAPIFLTTQRFYENTAARSRAQTCAQAFCAMALTALALILVLFLVHVHVARTVIILGSLLGGAFVYARSMLMARLTASRLAREQWHERILWIGDAALNNRHRAALPPDEAARITDLGDFDPFAQTPVQLTAFLHEHAVNTAIFTRASESAPAAAPVSWQAFIDCCAREGVSTVICAGVKLPVTIQPGAISLDTLGGETVIHCRAHRATPGDLALKRAIDIAGAALALIVLSPVFALIALTIKLVSHGPVIFRQTRAGLNGRTFTMLKFRTMRNGAHKEQKTLSAQNEMRGPVFKITSDPRLIPCGGFLRRHGLDEIPQLWNVLRGEMSLVGPRPLPDYEVRRFDDDAHRRRQSMRPGLTCLWQISGRNNIADFDEWVRLDFAYIDNWSPWLDTRIMLATIPVVIFGAGGR